jgi:succinate dehydrogenase / fumarate reductase cytochrome b subunit
MPWKCGPCARHHFLLRRLHSLSGLVPIGAFVAFHLFTNMQMLLGSFQHEVNWIHSQPALFFMEVGVLWLPIAFHGLLGLVYTFTGMPNNPAYPYGANWRYTLQRISGVLAMIFIFLHVAILRWRWELPGWYTPFFSKGISGPGGVVTDLAQYSTAVALANPLVLALYVVGVLAVVYHLANGLWTAAITWGLTLSVEAQRRWGYVCIAVFVALAGCGGAALVGAVSYRNQAPVAQRQAYEYMRQEYRAGHLSFERLEDLALKPTGTIAGIEP